MAVAKAIQLQLVFLFDGLDELSYLVDLNGHVIIDLHNESNSLGIVEVHLPQFFEQIDRSFLVEAGVDDEQWDCGF